MSLKKKLTAVSLTVVIALATIIAGAQSAPPQPDEATAVLRYLNQTVAWYRSVLLEQQLASEPADMVFAENSRTIALQVLRLTFEFGHSAATLLQAEAKRNSGDQPPAQDGAPQSKNLAQLAAAAQARVKQAQNDLETLQRQAATAPDKKRQILEDQIAEQHSEIDLAQARYQTLSSFVDFANTTGGTSATGLQAKVNELERTVPEARSTKSDTAVSAATPAPVETKANDQSSNQAPLSASRTQSYGIVALATDLFALSRKLRSQRDALDNTTALREQVNTIRSPMIARLRQVTQRGEELSSAEQSTDPKVLADRRKSLDELTAEFKQLSSVVVPIGKVGILLDAERSNLSQWRSDTERQYTLELRNLALRLIILAIAVGIVFLFSEFWRRATFRYVHDPRRRSQFLLLRRIVVSFTIVIVLLFSFATELGSLATFAGLITAGVALALQNVILSIAAYFFLIGKYGIRVGDRVQIGDVTGDVVDIGLVRLHLLELDTSTGDPQPTGRVVVFSNSVVFQPASNFFRQLPGSNFGWHRVSLSLASDVDYHIAKKRISDAVCDVYKDYRQEIERQHRTLEQNLTIPIAMPEPHTTVRFRDTSLEISVRYPVLLNDVSSIDDQITRAILAAVGEDPKLKLVGSGNLTIQTVHDVKKK
jgi:small-conductance mechanosensitive channel/cob(I)alamin adenosyltransferase